MRTFNVRLAIILLVVAAFLGAGVYFLHDYQISRNASSLFEASLAAEKDAAEAAKKGDVDTAQEARTRALRCLQWYIQLSPKDAAALEKLGFMFEDLAKAKKSPKMFQNAYGILERTVRVDPKRTKARRELVRMAMAFGRFQDAKEHLQIFLLKDSPKDPELLEWLGQALSQLGDYDQAMKTFKKAIECGPDRETAYAQLAFLLRQRLSRPKEADQWMSRMIAANPKSPKAHLTRCRYLLSMGRSEFTAEAAAEVAEALKLAPDDVDALDLSAKCAMARRKYDEARGFLVRGIRLFPSNVDMQTTMADLELIEGHREKAVAVLEQGLKATHRNPEVLWKLTSLQIDDQKFDEAKKGIEELQKAATETNYPQELVEYLLARIDLANQRWLAARKRLEGIRAALISRPMLLCQANAWIGLCYASVGDREKAAQFYRAALDVNPNFTPARTALVGLHSQSAQVDQGLEELGRLGPRAGSGAVASFLRLLFIKTLRQPLAERDWKAFETALNAVEKDSPNSVSAMLFRVQMLLAQGREQDADALLKKARKKEPKQPEYWGLALSLLEQKQNWQGTEKLLDESKAVFGDTPEQRLLEAGYLVARYKTEAGDRLRKLNDRTEKFSEAQCVALWSGLLPAADEAGAHKLVVDLCNQLVAKRPDNVQVRYMLLGLAVVDHDQAAMTKYLADIQRIAGQTAYWYWGKAVLADMQADAAADPKPLRDQALAYLAKARELRDDWPRIPSLMAKIHESQGKRKQAATEYLEAIDRGDRNAGTTVRAMQLLLQTQQYAELEKRLARMQDRGMPIPIAILQINVEAAAQQQDIDRAAKLLQEIPRDGLKTYQQQLWLGHILDAMAERLKRVGREPDAAKYWRDAEAAMKKAIDLDPKTAATWVSLVRHYASAGEPAKARATIGDAAKSIPAKESPLALAQCYDVLGDFEAAERKYDAAVAASPKDAAIIRAAADFFIRRHQPAKAEPLLQKVVGGEVKVDETSLAWARRQLAAVCFERGTYPDRQRARELIEKNREGAHALVNDLQILARLYMDDPSREKRAEASNIFEELVRNQMASDDDRFRLAQLYLADNNWSKARELLRGLALEANKPPAYLAFYIDNLIKRGETSDTEDYLERLKKATDNAFLAYSLQADWLVAVKHPQEAYDVLIQTIDAKDVQPRDRDERSRLVAVKLAELGPRFGAAGRKDLAEKASQQAESLYRAYVDRHPGRELAFASFLAERGKTGPAMDLVEATLKRSSAADLAPVFATIYERCKPDDKASAARLDRLMDAAIQSHGEATPLLMAKGDSISRQGRYDDAERAYRRVLEKSPNEAVAMNNLAILLGLQGKNLEDALKLANRAIEILGPNGAVLDSRALVHMARHDWNNAVKDINDAVNERETPVRLFHQAQILDATGQQAAAKTSMFKALHLGLTKEMLHPLEAPAFERLKGLAPKG